MTDAALVLRPVNPETLIASAIEKGVDVGVMERLLLMRKELRAEAAKEAYDHALAAFQAECPPIQKTKKVMNKDGRSVRYAYAPLETIISQVKDLLQKHGFSYRVNTISAEDKVKAICTSTHSMGHAENSEFEVPIEKGAFMSMPQQYASSLTFAKRYAFCNAFGIMTADEDNDANHEPPKQPAQTHAQPIKTPAPVQEVKKATTEQVLPPKEATEATRAWFLDQLRSVYSDEDIKTFFEKKAFIIPTEKIEDVPLRFVPISRDQMARFSAEMAVWAVGSPPASFDEEEPEFFKVVITIPRRGMKKVEYDKQPDTIGSLYRAMKAGDENAQSRLFGIAHNFEVKKTWTGNDNKEHARKPSEVLADEDLRTALNEFLSWAEERKEQGD